MHLTNSKIYKNQPTYNILFGRLPNKLSIYTAGMTAVIRAMAWICNNKIPKSVIFSDSLSTIMSIQSGQSLSLDLLNRIQQIQQQIPKAKLDLKLEWVMAHVSIISNETADYFAKRIPRKQ